MGNAVLVTQRWWVRQTRIARASQPGKAAANGLAVGSSRNGVKTFIEQLYYS
jgi:hypothetical protein